VAQSLAAPQPSLPAQPQQATFAQPFIVPPPWQQASNNSRVREPLPPWALPQPPPQWAHQQQQQQWAQQQPPPQWAPQWAQQQQQQQQQQRQQQHAWSQQPPQLAPGVEWSAATPPLTLRSAAAMPTAATASAAWQMAAPLPLSPTGPGQPATASQLGLAAPAWLAAPPPQTTQTDAAALAGGISAAALNRAAAKANLEKKRKLKMTPSEPRPAAAAAATARIVRRKTAATTRRGGAGTPKRCSNCGGHLKGNHAKKAYSALQPRVCRYRENQFAATGEVVGDP